MSQFWYLLNIDRQADLLDNNRVAQLIEVVYARAAEQLVGLLQRHKWVPFKISRKRLQHCKATNRSRLLMLPQEIIDLILGALTCTDDVSDKASVQAATNLALSCSYFFRTIAPYLQRYIFSGTWAGHRLVFLGDYIDGFPPGVTCEGETHEPIKSADGEIVRLRTRFPGMSLDLKAESEKDFDHIRRLCPFSLADTEDRRRFDLLLELITRPSKHANPALDKPVLRNLTTKEYVRDEALAEEVPALSLGEVIVALALWTSDPSGTLDLGMKGRWAGHRFDIATMEDVGDGWEDASEDAVDKLLSIVDYMDVEEREGRRA